MKARRKLDKEGGLRRIEGIAGGIKWRGRNCLGGAVKAFTNRLRLFNNRRSSVYGLFSGKSVYESMQASTDYRYMQVKRLRKRLRRLRHQAFTFSLSLYGTGNVRPIDFSSWRGCRKENDNPPGRYYIK